MIRRTDTYNPGQLEVCALYSVQTLARVAGVTEFLLLRLLKANGVELVRAGRAQLVPLTEIEAHIPPLWRAIVRAERLRADVRSGRDGER